MKSIYHNVDGFDSLWNNTKNKNLDNHESKHLAPQKPVYPKDKDKAPLNQSKH